jgi:phosphoribosylformimino-5-aminoimidazole carboxamide ribotide isomerase
MKFRPCIDLHQGKVKQIVGSTLSNKSSKSLITNFISKQSATWFANLYQKDHLGGGHMIQLGNGNEAPAKQALSAWPKGLQIGGGINSENALKWLELGASKVIVTSHIFKNGEIHFDRLKYLSDLIGKEQLVLDLSCRKHNNQYFIVTDRWQKFTNVTVDHQSLDFFAQYCSEFLIHAVDVEGKNSGIEQDLISKLGHWQKIPITYAGGISSWEDIQSIKTVGEEKIDFTIGSALDIFGGQGFTYQDLVKENANGFQQI